MKKKKNESILEYVSAQNTRSKIDREAGVIRDVKILGMTSRNDRIYPEETLRRAMRLYENARVNLNHPDGDPSESRKYQDRFGLIKNVRFEPGEGLFGDFHFNPKHPIAEQLLWDAEKSPENVGFSHNVQAVLNLRGGKQVVDKICYVRSVDLVADPATTEGLFENYQEKKDSSLLNEEEESEAFHQDGVENLTSSLKNEEDVSEPCSCQNSESILYDLTVTAAEPSEKEDVFDVSSAYPSLEDSSATWTQSVLQSEETNQYTESERPREKRFGLLSRCLQKLWAGKGNSLQEDWPKNTLEEDSADSAKACVSEKSVAESMESADDLSEAKSESSIDHYRRRLALMENLLESVLKDETFSGPLRTYCWNRDFVALLMKAKDPVFAEKLVEERQELIRKLSAQWSLTGTGEMIESMSGMMADGSAGESDDDDSAAEFIRQIKQII